MTTTVPGMLAARVAATPSATAFHVQGDAGLWQPLSWQDFAEQVERLRGGLVAAGLRAGDRLALIAPVSLRWELVHHAALAAGAVVVGLDAHDLPQRLAQMVEQADITVFVAADMAVLAALTPQRLAATRFVLRLAASGPAPPLGVRALDWDELHRADGVAQTDDARTVRADDLATIIFTSGTTGQPRGIAYTHGQVGLAAAAICGNFPFVDTACHLLCWLPLSNLFQRIVNLAALQQGAATYLLGDPRQVMQVVGGVSPDIFVAVPRFFEKLLDGVRSAVDGQPPLRRALAVWAWNVGRRRSAHVLQGRQPPWWLRVQHAAADRFVLARMRRVMGTRLRLMVSGSAPLSEHILQEFHALGWLVLEAYGLSENIVPMAMNRVEDFRFGTVGRPMASNEIVVGDDGAVKVRGPGVFKGYVGDPGPAPLDEAGYYTTGDLGAWDADGHLRLIGRSSELFKTSTGRRISPMQVEAALRDVAGIDQAVLIGAGRKFPIALCTLVAGTVDAPAQAALQARLAAAIAALPEHERPRGVLLLARPFSLERGELTPNLKLRRAAIETGHAEPIAALYQSLASQPARDGPLQVVCQP